MRDMILARVAEMRETLAGSQRLFGKPNHRGHLTGLGQRYAMDFDFSKLPDPELLTEFERFVRLSYRAWG